eukprot:6153858-Karenia_brevis.AAC.1
MANAGENGDYFIGTDPGASISPGPPTRASSVSDVHALLDEFKKDVMASTQGMVSAFEQQLTGNTDKLVQSLYKDVDSRFVATHSRIDEQDRHIQALERDIASLKQQQRGVSDEVKSYREAASA